MADCPLADDCPSFSERVQGMGCQHYGQRGGAEWCNHYDSPIEELKGQPVKPGEELVVTVEDIHESGAGVGRTEDGFIVLVDGVLPEARARVEVTTVRSNYANAEPLERLPMEDEEEGGAEDAGADEDEEGAGETTESGRPQRQELGSREDFWGQ